MKLPSEPFLDRANEMILRAPALLALGFVDEAGRAAYFAGFQAAQALIFEREDKVVKTHRGVQSEFSRLVKDYPNLAADVRGFLGRAYDLKTTADYGVDPDARVLEAPATEAIDTARRFVAAVKSLLGC